MSGHTAPAVFETYEQVYGRKSSIDELIAEVSKHEGSSILWIFAEIVCRIQLWARPGTRNRANYLRYLRELFEPSVANDWLPGKPAFLRRGLRSIDDK